MAKIRGASKRGSKCIALMGEWKMFLDSFLPLDFRIGEFFIPCHVILYLRINVTSCRDFRQ